MILQTVKEMNVNLLSSFIFIPKQVCVLLITKVLEEIVVCALVVIGSI